MVPGCLLLGGTAARGSRVIGFSAHPTQEKPQSEQDPSDDNGGCRKRGHFAQSVSRIGSTRQECEDEHHGTKSNENPSNTRESSGYVSHRYPLRIPCSAETYVSQMVPGGHSTRVAISEGRVELAYQFGVAVHE